MDDLASRLGRVSHFRQLPPVALAAIVSAGRMRRFTAGQAIFYESQACAGMFVLLSGRVHLVKPGPAGQEQILAVIEPVIMFNEVAVLDGGPNPMTAMSVKDALTWNIRHESFQELMGRYPVVGISLLRVLAARNRALILRCEDLSYRSVQARLAKLLLDLSQYDSSPVSRKENSIRHLAALIGTVPELVSRSLSSLQIAGFISYSRAEIALLDRDALARLAQVDLAQIPAAPQRPDQSA